MPYLLWEEQRFPPSLPPSFPLIPLSIWNLNPIWEAALDKDMALNKTTAFHPKKSPGVVQALFFHHGFGKGQREGAEMGIIYGIGNLLLEMGDFASLSLTVPIPKMTFLFPLSSLLFFNP